MTQKDDDGQQWEEYNEKAIGQGPFSAQYGIRVSRLNVMMVNGYGESARKLRDRILADHRDAQQLREQNEQLWRERNSFMQERDALLMEARRIEARLHKASAHYVHLDAMIDFLEADHERVRVLEEALREEAKCKGGCINGRHFNNVARRWYDCGACKGTGLTPKAAALLSPAAATEGGEGA